MLKLYSFAKKVTGKLVWVTFAILLGAMVFTAISVVARYVLKVPFLGSVEIIEVGMSALVFASLAWTQTEKGHVHITMLIQILPKKLGILLFALCQLVTTVMSAAAAYAIFQQGLYAIKIELVTAMTAIPYAPFYFFASLCMVVFTLVLLLDTIIAFGAVFNKKYQEFVCGSW